MSELLFFVIGLIVGGLTMTTFMCCLHINRINEMEKQILINRIESDEEDY